MNEPKKIIVASILPSHLTKEEAFKDLKELKELIDAYGGEVVDYILQKREIHSKGHYLGSGKVQEISQRIKETEADAVILNAIVKPNHLFEMKNQFRKGNPDVEVWDRVQLILQIFSQHAETTEARLQIDLAAMEHMGPRIYGMGFVLSRQSGGIGTRGIGETNTELMKRHWRNQKKKVEDKLKKLREERERQLERRNKIGMKTVSIIGYTNAGKTSLFNLLTGKQKLVQDALFATLDSSVGKIFLPQTQKEILISDTIGFIRNLPATLIEAFESTLLESLHADLLIHVIDISDPDMERKIETVEKVLYALKVENKPRFYVFNKIDQAHDKSEEEIHDNYEEYSPHFISVKNNKGIDTLLENIEKFIVSKESFLTNH